MTGWPVAAMLTARLAAVVDFPSPGSGLVTTITRAGWSTSTYCRLVRSSRIASLWAKDPRPSRMSSNENTARPAASSLSTGRTPTTAAPTASEMSLADRKRRSKERRTSAKTTPTTAPAIAPIATLSLTFGEDGAVGSRAESPAISRTAPCPLPGASSSSTCTVMPCSHACARSRADSGVDPVASTRTLTVSTGLDTWMRCTSDSGVSVRPSWSRAVSATERQYPMSMKDFTFDSAS
ncbi:hypothetical protein SRABI128_02289 [Microbacterium sp. Bi128]|nr:hypothetical protein SRABI128_02289 [Microbacterium sp. Bi128]